MRVIASLLALHWTNRPMRGIAKSKKSVMPVHLGDDWTNRPIWRRLLEMPPSMSHLLNASSETSGWLLRRLVYGDALHRPYAVPSAAHTAI